MFTNYFKGVLLSQTTDMMKDILVLLYTGNYRIGKYFKLNPEQATRYKSFTKLTVSEVRFCIKFREGCNSVGPRLKYDILDGQKLPDNDSFRNEEWTIWEKEKSHWVLISKPPE